MRRLDDRFRRPYPAIGALSPVLRGGRTIAESAIRRRRGASRGPAAARAGAGGQSGHSRQDRAGPAALLGPDFSPVTTDVACATCHHPELRLRRESRPVRLASTASGLGDRRRFCAAQCHSAGQAKQPDDSQRRVQRHPTRPEPTIRRTHRCSGNLRARSLEAQALEPIKTFEEMRGKRVRRRPGVAAVTARLNANAEYPGLFSRAFGARGVGHGRTSSPRRLPPSSDR